MRTSVKVGIVSLAALGLVVPVAVAPSPADAAQPAAGSSEDGIPTSFVDEAVPTGMTLADDIPEGSESLVPAATREAIVAVEFSGLSDQVTDIAWNDSAQTLDLYVHGDADEVLALIEQLAPEQAVTVTPAAYPRSVLDAALEQAIANGGELDNGVQVYSAWAEPDGSAITVTTDASVMSMRMAPIELGGIPVVFEAGEALAPATRSRTTGPVFSGGYMYGQGACTTGFPIRRVADAEPGMLSADHCGKAVSTSWWWGIQGTAVTVGFTTGQAGGGSDHEIWRQTQNPSVYTLVGAYNNSNSVLPIRGYYSAVAGDSVCYNGSRSGTVCGNTVLATNQAICYLPAGQCYTGLTSTNQGAGVPAAGNGDSGGPVMAFANGPDGTPGAYGAGIISGMSNPSTNCTGDPAINDRRCGTLLVYAPVSVFGSNNLTYNFLAAPTPAAP